MGKGFWTASTDLQTQSLIFSGSEMGEEGGGGLIFRERMEAILPSGLDTAIGQDGMEGLVK
jgi:hypothetical protein